MNERIEKLVKQADNIKILPDEEFCDTDFLADIDPRRVKKFAELIVQNILNSLETEREYYANPGTYQPLEYYTKMSAKEDALSDAISMIRSDFGVEK